MIDDAAADCSLQPDGGIQFYLPLGPPAIDQSGRMRVRQMAEVTNVEADVTLTSDLDLNGRVTAHFTTDINGATTDTR